LAQRKTNHEKEETDKIRANKMIRGRPIKHDQVPKALSQKYFELVLQSRFYCVKKSFVTSTILNPGLHENLRPG